MKYLASSLKSLLCLVFMVSLFMSCQDRDDAGDMPNDEQATIITLDLPAHIKPTTYTLETVDENYIRVLDILVFDTNDDFLYKTTATAIEEQSTNPDGEKKKYKANLHHTSGAEQVKLVLLANAGSNIGSPTVGEAKDVVLERIVFSLPADGKWLSNDGKNFTPIPMWGESGNVEIQGVPLPEIKILRALASIDVGTNYLGSSANELSNFILSEVHVYNVKSKGQLVPRPTNYDALTNKVTAPSIPTAAGINVDTPISYTALSHPFDLTKLTNYQPTNPRTEFIASERQIYLAEAPAATVGQEADATSIVVGGKFATKSSSGTLRFSDITYYRIDLLKTEGGVQSYIPILRNHRYRINISNVETTGYLTVEDAFANKAFNIDGTGMTVQIIADDSKNDLMTDGKHYLSIGYSNISDGAFFTDNTNAQSSTFVVPPIGGTIDMQVRTDYPNGWKVIVPDSLAANVTIVGSNQGAANVDGTFTIRVNTPIENYALQGLRIAAGSMSFNIDIRQEGAGTGQEEIMTIPANYGSNGNQEIDAYVHGAVFGQKGEYASWFKLTNTPSNYMSNDIPPKGKQIYPPIDISCAAATFGGYNNWRVPTIEEAKATYKYVDDQYKLGGKPYLINYLTSIISSASPSKNLIYDHLRVEPVTVGASAVSEPFVNSTGKKTTLPALPINRCVRTKNENYFLKTGTELSLVEKGIAKKIVIYTNCGLDWQKGDAEYDNLISNTVVTTGAADANGYTQYEISFTIMPITTMHHRKTSIILGSSPGGIFTQAVNLEKNADTSGTMLKANESGLNYDIFVAERDLPLVSWYNAVNMPDGYLFLDYNIVTTDVGLGGARLNSCAAMREDGLLGWRIPTDVEMAKIADYYKLRTEINSNYPDNFHGHYYYTFSNYTTGTGSTPRNLEEFTLQTMIEYTGKTNGTKLALSSSLSRTARCIRNAEMEAYSDSPINLIFAPYTETKSFYFDTMYDISGYTQTGNIVDNVTYSLLETDLNGVHRWIVTVTSRTAANITDNAIGTLTLTSAIGGKTKVINLERYMDLYINNNMMYAMRDQMPRTWYIMANVPDGHNSTDVPPAGLQVTNGTGTNGSRPGSCADATYGGFTNWRLPTESEHLAGVVRLNTIDPSKNWIRKYGFTKSLSVLYWTATTPVAVNYARTRTNQPGSGQRLKTTANIDSRCVRTP